jgi:hypothetical protein
MAKDTPDMKVFAKGELLCEPLVDKVPDPTSVDGSMLVFPDFNVFVMPEEVFKTKAGLHVSHEDIKPGIYVWVDWKAFLNRDDACLHWSSQVIRLPIEKDLPEVEPPPLAG